jgi:hypothetical protein
LFGVCVGACEDAKEKRTEDSGRAPCGNSDTLPMRRFASGSSVC